MIRLPKFNEEEWYLKEILELFVDGRYSEERKKAACEQIKSEIQELLNEIIEEDIFSDKDEKNILRKLILAPFGDLKKIYLKIKELNYNFYEEIEENGTIKREMKPGWRRIYNVYDKLIAKKINIQLINKYGIKCCPYCNENYIYNRSTSAVAQLDHFYPRSEFPIFAVCLHNLVPVCSACNHIKLEKEIGVSPHDYSWDFSHLKISYKPKSAGWIDDEKELEIEFIYDDEDSAFKEEMNKNLKEMKIRKAYENHVDYVQEIIKKAQIYNKDNRSSLLLDFPELFESDDELVRVIFGNYINEQDLLKRPLSKLTRDLLEELHIL